MFVFGIDIGGTQIKIGFFTETGKLLQKWSIPTDKEKLLQKLADNLLNFCQNNNIKRDDILGYGIGIPGIVKDNIAVKCVNLHWSNVDVILEFKKAIGYDAKVAVLNDAKLASYGEFVQYNGKYDSIVFITLGTGIGSGIIVNSKIQEGAFGICGEVGHIRIEDKHHFKCSCGKTGCLETVASATGIVRLAKHYYGKVPTKIKSIDHLSAKDVVDAARVDDPLGTKVLDEACYNIAKALAMLSLSIDPNAFVIGGGVSYAGQILIDKIKKYYIEECLEEAKNVDIIISNLRNDAGIYGASAYIIQKEKGVLK